MYGHVDNHLAVSGILLLILCTFCLPVYVGEIMIYPIHFALQLTLILCGYLEYIIGNSISYEGYIFTSCRFGNDTCMSIVNVYREFNKQLYGIENYSMLHNEDSTARLCELNFLASATRQNKQAKKLNLIIDS